MNVIFTDLYRIFIFNMKTYQKRANLLKSVWITLFTYIHKHFPSWRKTRLRYLTLTEICTAVFFLFKKKKSFIIIFWCWSKKILYFPSNIFFYSRKKTIKENVHSKLNQIFLSIAMRCVTESPSTTILNKEYVHQHTWTNNIKIKKQEYNTPIYEKVLPNPPKTFFLTHNTIKVFPFFLTSQVTWYYHCCCLLYYSFVRFIRFELFYFPILPDSLQKQDEYKYFRKSLVQCTENIC